MRAVSFIKWHPRWNWYTSWLKLTGHQFVSAASSHLHSLSDPQGTLLRLAAMVTLCTMACSLRHSASRVSFSVISFIPISWPAAVWAEQLVKQPNSQASLSLCQLQTHTVWRSDTVYVSYGCSDICINTNISYSPLEDSSVSRKCCFNLNWNAFHWTQEMSDSVSSVNSRHKRGRRVHFQPSLMPHASTVLWWNGHLLHQSSVFFLSNDDYNTLTWRWMPPSKHWLWWFAGQTTSSSMWFSVLMAHLLHSRPNVTVKHSFIHTHTTSSHSRATQQEILRNCNG